MLALLLLSPPALAGWSAPESTASVALQAVVAWGDGEGLSVGPRLTGRWWRVRQDPGDASWPDAYGRHPAFFAVGEGEVAWLRTRGLVVGLGLGLGGGAAWSGAWTPVQPLWAGLGRLGMRHGFREGGDTWVLGLSGVGLARVGLPLGCGVPGLVPGGSLAREWEAPLADADPAALVAAGLEVGRGGGEACLPLTVKPGG